MSLTAGNLYISSYNNQDNDSSTDFTITLAVPVTKAKRIRVLGATIPNLMMPFGANDSLFRFAIGNAGYTVYFATDKRWSSLAAFCTYMGTLISNAISGPEGITATVTVNQGLGASEVNNRLTITLSNPAKSITIPPWNWNNTNGGSVSYNANFRLGWTSISPVTSVAGVLTADGYPNIFLRTNNIYITTNISTDSNNDANIGNIVGRIPVTIDYGGLIVYNNVSSDFSSPVFSENIKDIRVRLLDEDYQPLVNPANAYFNVVFGIDY